MTAPAGVVNRFDITRYTPDVAAIASILWDVAGLAMQLVRGDCTLLAANPAAARLISESGLKVGDRVTQGVTDVYLDEETEVASISRRPLERGLRGEVVRRQLVRFRTKAMRGEVRLRVTALPVTLNDGDNGVLMVWEDVSDEWSSERRQSRDFRRIEQILDGTSDYSILMLDAKGRVSSWTPSAERIHGYRHDEAIGLPYEAFFLEEDRVAGVPDQILANAARIGNESVSGIRVHRSGTTFWAEGSVSALRDDAGDLSGYLKVTRDVTNRVAAERAVMTLNEQLQTLNEQLRTLNGELESRVAERTGELTQKAADLEAANAELEAFSYSVSHDLRAPLRAMSGYARLVEEIAGDRLPEPAVEYLGKLNNGAVTMGQLIDGLLSLSRTQRSPVTPEPLDMTALAAECWEALAGEREGRDVAFELADLPPVRGDRRLVRQVWMNLLQNAIKYTGTREQAVVQVTGSVDGGVPRFQVRDNGVGFEMRYAGKIGQVFQRLHADPRFAGTGIGMATVQRILSRHGGEFGVHGEPDAGATITFTLGGSPR